MKNNVIVGELLDEKSLLVVKTNKKIYINYLDSENKFRQSYIGQFGKDAIEFGFRAVAVVTPDASKHSLKKIYDLNTHEFVKEVSKYEFYESRFTLKYPIKTKKM